MGFKVKKIEGFRPTEKTKEIMETIIIESYKKGVPLSKTEFLNKAVELAETQLKCSVQQSDAK